MYKRFTALLLLALLLSACGPAPDAAGPEPAEAEPEGFVLSVSLPALPETLDPLRSSGPGSETVLYHLFENLMRWEDDGRGWAVLAPGQAESYTVETDYAGNATYTFTLREDACWSDGSAVTANDFVATWQKLADPEAQHPHRELMAPIAGYDQVQETGDVSLLAVSAPDDRTFVVSLNGSCAYFLEAVCASAYTVPRCLDAVDGSVTNGPYIAAGASGAHVALARNENYYAKSGAGPDEIHFYAAGTAESEYQQLQEGTRDLITALPEAALQELAESGAWLPEPVTSVYGVLLNTCEPPFDDPNVRLAFRLAVDTQAVADGLEPGTTRAASGLVPYGVADYGERPVQEETEEEEEALPDPNALAPEEPEEPEAGWDFRMHSLERVTVPTESDHEENCQRARTLLSEAGYPNGSGFPAVEYVYVNSPRGTAIAGALRSMWQTELNIPVAIRGLSQEEYDALLLHPAVLEDAGEAGEEASQGSEESGESEERVVYTMAAQDFAVGRSNVEALLERWCSGDDGNLSAYHSEAFDILLSAAQTASAPEVRDAYLHDAEAILLEEAPVIPVVYQSGSYLLAEGLTGLYRAPDGVYFLFSIAEESAPA